MVLSTAANTIAEHIKGDQEEASYECPELDEESDSCSLAAVFHEVRVSHAQDLEEEFIQGIALA